MNLVITALRNRLEAPHANVCMRIASSRFSHNDFPFERAYKIWKTPSERNNVF